MAGTQIIIDPSGLDPLLTDLEQLRARMRNARPLMAEIGEILVESSQRNFEEHRSPEGDRWEPLSAAYALRKQRRWERSPDDLLILHRTLMGSIHWAATGESVAVGTDVVYAAVHQLGWAEKNIPARPFLGIREEDWDEINDAVYAFLRGE